MIVMHSSSWTASSLTSVFKGEDELLQVRDEVMHAGACITYYKYANEIKLDITCGVK